MLSHRKPLATLLVALTWLTLASCHHSPNNSAQAANAGNNSSSLPDANGANNPPGQQAQSATPAQAQQPVQTLTVPAGTQVVVRLADPLSSSRNRRGDTFIATLDEPLIVDNYVVAPKDSKVVGRVVAARQSGHLKTPADLAITLTSLKIGNESYRIATTRYGRRAQGHAKHNAKWIAALAGGGALLGALVGHGKGAAIGAGVGAGAGTGAAYATGKKDIYFPAEMRVRFRLQQPLTVTEAG